MKVTIQIFFLLLALPAWWPAQANLSNPEDHTFITVRELMRLEGEQALEAARQRRGQGAAAHAAPTGSAAAMPRSSAADAPRLVGIYGVGKRLFAEVRRGSEAWLFLNGRSLPLGRMAGEDSYRLREVGGACVRLERQGEETVLCLPRGGR